MAKIVIKDLNESKELDRKAMAAILGGSRSIGSSGGAYAYNYKLFRKTYRPFIESLRKGRLKQRP